MPASHTSRDFESELRELRAHLLAMGARCERSVQLALKAFMEGSAELSSEVKALDKRIDRDEVESDDLALRILALRQPVAHDLRLLATALKLVTDLERIGDEAVNIAERAEEAGAESKLVPHPHLRSMAELTQQMLRDALDAFVQADVDRAERVRLGDDAVDALYGKALREMMGFMAEHPERIPAAMGVVNVAKYLERIADHATNIAEEVIFMVVGNDVRHERGTPPPPPMDEVDE
jgi:phosphate transport system protein